MRSENSGALLKRETSWDYPYQNEGGQLGPSICHLLSFRAPPA